MGKAKKLVQMLSQRGQRLATAESITGGLIASTVVSVQGASKVLHEGYITYSEASKVSRLGVPPKMLQQYGAVSHEVCKAMFAGLMASVDIDYAVVTTGYADGKDAGVVYIGAGSRVRGVVIARYLFTGSRNSIRKQAANTAISMLYELAKTNFIMV